jgi:phosphoenolpyruvate carboxykinase (GTP)
MGDYFQHWLNVGAISTPERLPRIYAVNWFRKDANGRFLWPGFGENSRVLKWIFERCEGEMAAKETEIGYVPNEGGIDLSGLSLAEGAMQELLKVDLTAWKHEVGEIRKHFELFGRHLPRSLANSLYTLEKKLNE